MKKYIIASVLCLSAIFFVYAQNAGTESNPEGKFWGESCTTHHYPDGDYEWCCYYVFWINTGCDYAKS